MTVRLCAEVNVSVKSSTAAAVTVIDTGVLVALA
jgi:hypothetical protein